MSSNEPAEPINPQGQSPSHDPGTAGEEPRQADSDGVDPIRDAPALLAKNRELLATMRKLKDRQKDLEAAALVAGVDVADPVGFIARRKAEAEARAGREARVRDEVLLTLVDSGHKIGRTVLTALVTAAIADPTITADEHGNLNGVPEYVDGWLTSLRGEPPRRSAPGLPISDREPASPRLPRLAGPDSSYATFTDLMNQGPAVTSAFERANPIKYAALRDAHFKALQNPTRTQPPK